jgi:hypothetical protein
METLTRLVTESLARHGFDRPLDYRRLQWSHWFRCESHHSLLIVPSKPGVFALAEEVMDLNQDKDKDPAETFAAAVPRAQSKSKGSGPIPKAESREPKAEPSRMLAVAKFFEDDDMAFVLDRMLSHENPLRTRLASGRYFIRFVVIEDPFQRRSVCNALNQWIVSSAEKATGIGSHFATSLEFTPDDEQPCVETAASPALSRVEGAVPRTVSEAKGSGTGNSLKNSKQADAARPTTAPRLNSAIDTTIHCSSSFPSGF